MQINKWNSSASDSDSAAIHQPIPLNISILLWYIW